MSSIVYFLTTPGKTAPTFTFISISLTVLSCLEENVNKPGLVSQPTKLIILSLYSMPKIIQNTRISEGFTLNQFMRNSSILVINVNIKLKKRVICRLISNQSMRESSIIVMNMNITGILEFLMY